MVFLELLGVDNAEIAANTNATLLLAFVGSLQLLVLLFSGICHGTFEFCDDGADG